MTKKRVSKAGKAAKAKAQAAKAKKDAAFEELYRTYVPQVIAVAMHRLSDPHLAEDVVQETFLRAYRDIDKLDPTKPAWTWLSVIVMNLCRDEGRLKKLWAARLSSQLPEEVRDLIEPRADPADEYVVRERIRAMMTALEQINVRYRRVLVLQYGQGLRTLDIAAQEEISETAAESVLKRARENFRAAYEQAVKERGLQGVVFGGLRFRPRYLLGRIRDRIEKVQEKTVWAMPAGSSGVYASFVNLATGLAITVTLTGTLAVGSIPLFQSDDSPIRVLSSETRNANLSGPDGGNSAVSAETRPTIRTVSSEVSSKGIAPNAPEASTSTVVRVTREERTTVSAKVEARFGETPLIEDEEDDLLYFYCDDGRVQRTTCAAIDTIPST